VLRYVSNLLGVAVLGALASAALWILAEDRSFTDPLAPPNVALYPKSDPWAEYLAPESECPGGENSTAGAAGQERTMVCLVNWARAQRRLEPLAVHTTLARGALQKAAAIEACKDFSHNPCGHRPSEAVRSAGYRGASWGENLYLGSGEHGSPRVALDRWLNSDRHRRTLFGAWTKQGFAVLRVSVSESQDANLWVGVFGHG
jgi:uncharacterized protein YkwD